MKIQTAEQLRTLYPQPAGRTKLKVLPALEKHSRNFIETSPFLVISSADASGKMDTSPRGGQPGFVHILDDNRILIPDAKGNNRIDSLINIVETGNVGLLFLIPGIDETLRVNGQAIITTEPELLALFAAEKIPPKTGIIVEIQEVFLHCAKALMRSKLWHEEAKVKREDFPSMGRMMKDQLGGEEPVETQEAMVERYRKDL